MTSLLKRVFLIVIALIPWALALYLHYWLEYAGVWDVEMPFRALISGLMIAVGMVLSFLLHSLMSKLGR